MNWSELSLLYIIIVLESNSSIGTQIMNTSQDPGYEQGDVISPIPLSDASGIMPLLISNVSRSWNILYLQSKFYHSSFLLIILHFLTVPTTAQLLFNYPGFTPNIKDLIYHGDAAPTNQVIHLTSNQNDRGMDRITGRITYTEPLKLWDKASGNMADFSTYFAFTINSQNRSDYADGIAFFLAPVGFPITSVQLGAGIGLVSEDQINSSTMNPFVAVEFDTFMNPWDPRHDHVGININSMVSVTNVTWLSRVPAGVKNEAWISYNSTTMNLSVSFTSFPNNNTYIESLSYKVDLRTYLPERVEFGISAATGRRFWEIHAVHSWNFNSSIHLPTDKNILAPPPKHNLKRKENGKVIVGIVVGALASVLIMTIGLLWCVRKKKWNRIKKENKNLYEISCEFEKETGPRKFSYDILSTATRNFAEGEKVGQGGFGEVYKGFLCQLNSYVSVKRVSRGSKQGIKEYASEVRIISQLRHRNLVQLIGWCHEERELLLVYEFLPNGSLDSYLFRENLFLTWIMRYNITRGLASALLYLHEGCEQCVLHRDIKASNIMLDSNFNCKLGDFGLARFVDHGKETETTMLAGTMGYIAPDCFTTGKVSKETDVYSFGIVTLEIASGRKPINPRAKQGEVILVEWIWDLYGKGEIVSAADPKLSADFNEKQLICLMVVGLWCAHPDHKFRPSIRQALQVLNFEAPLPDLALTYPMLSYVTAPLDPSSNSLQPSSDTVAYKTWQTVSSGDANSSNCITSSSSALLSSTK